MKKMKFLAIAAALSACIAFKPAHAGFLTGVVVGSALSGDNKSYSGSPTVVTSDKEGRDIITCPAHLHMQKPCIGPYYREKDKSGEETLYNVYTPGAFAYMRGYKTLHSQGVLITPDGKTFILMEVSK